MTSQTPCQQQHSTESSQRKLITIPGKTNPIDINSKIDKCKHFTWAEALNSPPRIPANWQITANIIEVALLLDGLRDFLGEPIHVTSWYRDPLTNRLVGGAVNSQHMQGNAVDFYIESTDGHGLGRSIDSKVQGGLGVYSSWVHVDLGAYARW